MWEPLEIYQEELGLDQGAHRVDQSRLRLPGLELWLGRYRSRDRVRTDAVRPTQRKLHTN